MHECIVRTKEEIDNHVSYLMSLKDETNIALASYLLGISESDNRNIREDLEHFPEHSKANNLEKLSIQLIMWLTGKLFTPPSYVPLSESQYSAEQVLEDFGYTKYTDFVID